jgi:hypothetical protein
MKTLVVYLSLALLAVARVSGDEFGADTKPSERHAKTLIALADTNGLVVWTNTVKYPITLRSVFFDAGVAHTSSVAASVVRRYDHQFQIRASEVVTNEFGEVVTNTFNQVTNIVVSVTSNALASVTVSNVSASFSINHLTAAQRLPEDLYTRFGDVWYFNTRPSRPVIASFTE